MNSIYNFLLKVLKPFIIWFGSLHFPFTHKKITGEHYYKWRDSIDVGTVFLSKTRGELSNILNPLEIKHGAIYVGKIKGDDVCYVAEAVGRGVVLTDLVSFMTSKDTLIAVEPTFLRDEEVFEKSLHAVTGYVLGTPYDYLFQEGGEAFYCFELVQHLLSEIYSGLSLQAKEIVKGKKIYDANTFLDERFFKVIFDSRKG